MSLPAGVSEYHDVAVTVVAWGSEHRYHLPGRCGTPAVGPFPTAGECDTRCNQPCPVCWPDTAPAGLWPVVNQRP